MGIKLKKPGKKKKIIISPKKIGIKIKNSQINVEGDFSNKEVGIQYQLKF